MATSSSNGEAMAQTKATSFTTDITYVPRKKVMIYLIDDYDNISHSKVEFSKRGTGIFSIMDGISTYWMKARSVLGQQSEKLQTFSF